jgi:glutaminyl-tRNA synthetase
MAMLEHCAREELNRSAKRVMAVLEPLKLIITNYPEGQSEKMIADNNPEDPSAGTREIVFSRELYIEQNDFMENPPGKFFRLKPGGEVRLKHAYIIRCEEIIKDEKGNVTELHCTYDPESKSGGASSGRKVKGTLHWVAADHAIPAEIRRYEPIYSENVTSDEDGGEETVASDNFGSDTVRSDTVRPDTVNPRSLVVLKGLVEDSLRGSCLADRFQFLRQGYFCLDSKSPGESLVFNRIVGLRDSYSKK